MSKLNVTVDDVVFIEKEHVFVFTNESFEVSPVVEKHLGDDFIESLKKVAEVEKFTGKNDTHLSMVVSGINGVQKITVVGLGNSTSVDFTKIGGKVSSLIKDTTSVLFHFPQSHKTLENNVGDFVLGLRLGSYKFDRYFTKKKEEEPDTIEASVYVSDLEVVETSLEEFNAVSDGVIFARDLVNEPSNILHPEFYADKLEELREIGLEVEVLDEHELETRGFDALTSVGRGSKYKSKVVTLKWNGGNNDKPLAFVGKGVTFDTGGISIKPSGSMEDMKGDMGGSAAVVGLMIALAKRKARVNVVGVVGIVENMVGHDAYRPGDIIGSLSGQTIEIVNTDAEGRLVLADVLWHTQEVHNPKFVVNLATLTGAILVALGQDNAGLFSNDDSLAEKLFNAGKDTGETVWRLPLQKEYDKLIDSKFADMKNSGSRYAGSITAAQFLQRFIKDDTKWAHLDIAGTAMGSPQTETNKSWGSGWGVRILNNLVKQYEK